MSENYAEEEHIGKSIMQEFFTKTRLTEKQPGHRLWVNNKETQQTPSDLDNFQPDKIVDLTAKEEIVVDSDPIHIPPPPGLEQPMPQLPMTNNLAQAEPQTIPEMPTSRDIPDKVEDAEAAPYKPTHRLTGKQTPPQPVRGIVAQLDDITITILKEIRLENNEDKEEKRQMESVMSDVQAQPWFQYELDFTMFSERAVKDAMNKELSQLITCDYYLKQPFVEVDKRSLTAEQLQQVVATRWVITTRPSNNGAKDIKC
eukprot:4412796-Amphidinium_carterae.1